jgi:hypothetical protein
MSKSLNFSWAALFLFLKSMQIVIAAATKAPISPPMVELATSPKKLRQVSESIMV